MPRRAASAGSSEIRILFAFDPARLAQLREDAAISQTELARRMGVSQPRISQLEQGDPGQMELDTLRRYITALGGRMRVVADFDDHDVTVSAVERDSA